MKIEETKFILAIGATEFKSEGVNLCWISSFKGSELSDSSWMLIFGVRKILGEVINQVDQTITAPDNSQQLSYLKNYF